jgi:hypothetical protein
MTLLSVACLLVFALQQPPAQTAAPQSRTETTPPEKSAYLAFVDREYIFTIELVKQGIPLLNFVSMSDTEHNLLANQVRLTLETRKVPGTFFMVDTGNPKEPMITPSIRMRPRSSFGVRMQGSFGEAKELPGATISIGAEDFRLFPLTSFEFENLALKVNRLNLSSPDFSDDWRVLKFELIGSRALVRRVKPR